MTSKKLFAVAALVAAVTVVSAIVSISIAAETTPKPEAAPADFKLPPGWTMEDMQACIVAGTPGKMHELLAKDAGVWEGENTMWMVPGADPVKSKMKATIAPVMDGRYVKIELNGDLPGMGPYNGLGYCGFDNVSQKFVATWLDNHSTGIMNGTGELSNDQKVLTWNYNGNCPLTKQPITMREVDTVTGPNSKRMEMFGPDPKTGKEFKMMSIELTKTN